MSDWDYYVGITIPIVFILAIFIICYIFQDNLSERVYYLIIASLLFIISIFIVLLLQAFFTESFWFSLALYIIIVILFYAVLTPKEEIIEYVKKHNLKITVR